MLNNFVIHKEDNRGIKFYEAIKYGKSSMSPSYSEEFIYVNSCSIDGFCTDNSIAQIDLIKVDVRYMKLFVFQGMQNLLRNKKVKNIYLKFEYWAERDVNLEIDSAQRYLMSLGYELYDMNGKALEQIPAKTDAMIWAKPADDKY